MPSCRSLSLHQNASTRSPPSKVILELLVLLHKKPLVSQSIHPPIDIAVAAQIWSDTGAVGWVLSTTGVIRVLQLFMLLVVQSNKHLRCDDYFVLFKVFDLQIVVLGILKVLHDYLHGALSYLWCFMRMFV